MEKLFEEILKTHVFSFIDNSTGYLIGIVKREEYFDPEIDYQQSHFDGKTLEEALQNAVNFLTSD